MEKMRVRIDLDLKFEELIDINPSFATAKVAICYTGRNRNKTDIAKTVLQNSIKSLFNCPIVGRYDTEKDDFGGHDIRIATDKKTGEMIVENATVPFGIVPESSIVEFKDITGADGTVHEYMFADIILWKRQQGYDCIKGKGKLGQSMEITVNSYIIDTDGYCIIEDMNFEALCILGSDVTPCFENASIEIPNEYSFNTFKTQFSEMLNELKETNSAKKGKISGEGGNNLEINEVFDKILEEFNLSADQIDFEITEKITEDDLKEKLAAISESNKNNEVKTEEYSTYNQKREALYSVLPHKVVRNNDDEIISELYYFLMDFDNDYVYVEKWSYSDGKRDEKYGRLTYKYNEESMSAEITSDFEQMVITWLTLEENAKLEQSRNAFEMLQKEFSEYKETHSAENSEVEDLKTFKNDALNAEHKQIIDLVLEEFEDLNDNAEFEELKKTAYELKEDDLRKECYVIRGKCVQIKHEPKKTTYTKLPVGQPKDAEPYGGLFMQFNNRKEVK